MANKTVQQLRDDLDALVEKGFGGMPVTLRVQEYNDEGYSDYEADEFDVLLSGNARNPKVIVGTDMKDDY